MASFTGVKNRIGYFVPKCPDTSSYLEALMVQRRNASEVKRRKSASNGAGGPPKKTVFPPPFCEPRNEFSLLAKTDDSTFQLLLWQRARDVRLWAGTAQQDRPHLFSHVGWDRHSETERAASEVEALEAPIRVLAALVRFPEVVHPSDVSPACLAISAWADQNHLTETALEFAEIAAFADPTSARAAADAGQACARAAADARAEVWYERSRKLARRTEDWEWYIRSYIRLCILRYEQGRFRDATRCAVRARNQAIWAGMLAFAGKAHHDMLLISMAMGSFPNANRHAQSALRYYPHGYERLPYFAHDYAILLTTFGCHIEALSVLDAVLAIVTKPAERLVVLGTVAKAAAGSGDLARYKNAVDDVRVLSQMYESCAAGALAIASEGALAASDWHIAGQFATQACEIATRRHEREPQRRATLVTESVATRSQPKGPDPVQPSLVADTTATLLDLLTELCIGQRTTDAGAHTRGRGELTKFSIAGR